MVPGWKAGRWHKKRELTRNCQFPLIVLEVSGLVEVTVEFLLGLDFLKSWAVLLVGGDGNGEAAQSCRGGDEDQGHFLLPGLWC